MYTVVQTWNNVPNKSTIIRNLDAFKRKFYGTILHRIWLNSVLYITGQFNFVKLKPSISGL